MAAGKRQCGLVEMWQQAQKPKRNKDDPGTYVMLPASIKCFIIFSFIGSLVVCIIFGDVDVTVSNYFSCEMSPPYFSLFVYLRCYIVERDSENDTAFQHKNKAYLQTIRKDLCDICGDSYS